jgi:hypothetical protein
MAKVDFMCAKFETRMEALRHCNSDCILIKNETISL